MPLLQVLLIVPNKHLSHALLNKPYSSESFIALTAHLLGVLGKRVGKTRQDTPMSLGARGTLVQLCYDMLEYDFPEDQKDPLLGHVAVVAATLADSALFNKVARLTIVAWNDESWDMIGKVANLQGFGSNIDE